MIHQNYMDFFPRLRISKLQRNAVVYKGEQLKKKCWLKFAVVFQLIWLWKKKNYIGYTVGEEEKRSKASLRNMIDCWRAKRTCSAIYAAGCCPFTEKVKKIFSLFFYFFLSKTSSALQHMLGILNGNAQIHAKHFLVISEGWLWAS